MQLLKSISTRPYFALSDEIRFRAVRCLCVDGREHTLTALGEALNVEQSKLSKHVQVLVWAELIAERRSGRKLFLRANTDKSHVQMIQSSVMSVPDEQGLYALDLEQLSGG